MKTLEVIAMILLMFWIIALVMFPMVWAIHILLLVAVAIVVSQHVSKARQRAMYEVSPSSILNLTIGKSRTDSESSHG